MQWRVDQKINSQVYMHIQRRQPRDANYLSLYCRSPFKITGDEQVLQEMALVDTKEPVIYRATHAAADAMSPKPIHHSQAKLVNGELSWDCNHSLYTSQPFIYTYQIGHIAMTCHDALLAPDKAFVFHGTSFQLCSKMEIACKWMRSEASIASVVNCIFCTDISQSS